MIEKVNKKKAYHICIYPEYILEIDKEYDTKLICRNYDNVAESKKETELNFEEFRLKNCSKLPSRRNCLYVCTEKTIEYWHRTLTRKSNIFENCMIFEIELDGEVFWADGICFLEGDEINYWKGCMCDEAPGVEGLFTGKYTAKRKVKIEDIITT